MSASSMSASRPTSAARSSTPRRGPASTSSRRSRWRPCRPTLPPWSRRPGRLESRLGLVHNYLFQPEIILARELIRSGALGQVEVVIINYLGVARLSRECGVRPDVAARPCPVRRRHLHRHHPPGLSRRSVARPARRAGLGLRQCPDDGRRGGGHRLEPLRDSRECGAHQCRLELRSRRDRRAGRHRGQRHATVGSRSPMRTAARSRPSRSFGSRIGPARA